MAKTDIVKTFKVDSDFDSWLTDQRNHPALTELGLSELIRLALKVAIPILQMPPCWSQTVQEFHRRSQS